MARIPTDEIERLKTEVSVERLIESAGIALARAGKDRIGKCPFHADDTASLVVTPAKNLWHCFGCQIGGGPIDWVMKKNAVSFRHAVELLRDGDASLSSSLAASSVPLKRATVRTLPAPVTRDADNDALMLQVVGYYHDTLKHSPEALDYLRARGLDHPELIDTFKLGFANRTLGLRLPEKNRLAGAELRTRLQAIGIYRQSGHEHFNGSLVVPVLDEAGRVVEVYGRKVRDDLRAGTPKHLYLPEACRAGGRGVWNMRALMTEGGGQKEIIVCEALIDAMTFWCAGYRNVTAAYGIEGFTEEHLAAFRRYNVVRVLIAYDRDEPGERAAGKLAETLMAAGIECWRIQFPKGMDANAYALKVTPAAKSLGVVIRKAAWLGKGQAPARNEIGIATGPKSSTGAAFEGLVSEAPADIASPADVSAEIPLPSLAAAVLTAEAAKQKISPALSASPVPSVLASDVHADVSEHEVRIVFGSGLDARHYRIRGLAKNLAYGVVKVQVVVTSGERVHGDVLDLAQARARAGFVAQAAIELKCEAERLKQDLARAWLKCEALQDEAIRKTLEPPALAAVVIDEVAQRAALAMLKSPELMDRIVADFDAIGIVGEATNKLVGYLAAVSRKLDRPLAVVIQSSSAAGKSSLMDAVLTFMPEEERIKYSAMTGQSLFYMGETNLKHKILAIVEEEGASKASYALKLLQSEGELTIASTGKDPATGNLITQQYRVEGPVMIFLTTTAIEIDEELMNRCLVLSVDEGRAQTEAIHRLQRASRTLRGLIAKQDRQHRIELHQNAQRLIRPLAVVNPYADQLTFLSDKTRARRDHEKYLTLIDAIALLHQHQRSVKTATARQGDDSKAIEYIEVTLEDIARANALAHEVLGRSLDELPPQTRRLLGEVVGLVRARASAQQVRAGDVRFTRKDVREAAGWSDTQLRVHLDRLVEMEYLATHREGAGGKFVYELMYDGVCDEKPYLSGLIDTNALKNTATTAKSRGVECEVAPCSRGDRGALAGGSRDGESAQTQGLERRLGRLPADGAESHVLPPAAEVSSYPQRPSSAPLSTALPLAASSAVAHGD